MDDLFAALKEVADRVPGSIASFSRHGYLTHRAFFRNIDSVARRAVSLGIKPGQLAVVRCSHQDARLQLILGLMRVGCRVGISNDLSSYQAHEVPIDILISDDPKATGAKRVLPVSADWFKPNQYVSLPAKASFSVIFNSSGSTGAGKLMEISERGFLYRLSNRFNDLHHGPRPRFLCFGGLGTSNSLQDSIVVLLKAGMILRPIDETGGGVLDALQYHHPDYMFATPSMIVHWMRLLEETPATIEKVKVLRIGGAYCSPEARSAALTHFAENLVMSFGSTETGNIASLIHSTSDQTSEVAGKVRADVEIRTFDDAGNPLPDGATGELRIKVPDGVMATYIGKSQSAMMPIRDGWFVSGDIGAIDGDRNLRILGRASQIINTGGAMVNPETLEAVAAEYAGIKEIGVVGVPAPEGFQRIHAAVVAASPLSLDRLNAYLQQRRNRFILEALHTVDALPKTEAGKLDRPALRRLINDRLPRGG